MLNTGKLAGKTLYITGASRGIGKAIALKAAKDGAKVVVAAKTAEPHPKLPGTIFTAAKEIEAAGGEAFPCVVDVRDESQVQQSIEDAVRRFGGIDIVINNASAISLTGTEATSMKKYDLMNQINARGTFLVSKCAMPYLRASKNNPHILNISPPLNLNPRWFKGHVAYTMAKYGMSMCVLGMAEEFKEDRIAVNALWPRTAIITAAMEMLGGGKEISKSCRTVDIMADAAYVILTRDARNYTGNFAIDETVLREEGCTDFTQYACVPGHDLMPDFFLDEDWDAKEGGSKPSSSECASSSGGGVAAVFDALQGNLSEELVQSTKAVFAFNVKGDKPGVWFLDLKNGTGACGSGEPPSPADVTFTVKENDFQDIFQGKIGATAAFMSGKLKMKGDMGKALALETIMKKVHGSRGYHTMATGRMYGLNNNIVRFYSDAPKNYTNVPEVFDRIQEVANSDIVKKVDATYLFEVEDEGKFYVDLKNGDGAVTKGEPPEVADVTIIMNKDNILKMFNRELQPATAFMTGQLKLKGDLAKAMALESIMKASRGERAFHTMAGRYRAADAPPTSFQTVTQVFQRINGVANQDMVSQVKAIYLFDVEEEGKFHIDLKNGDGFAGKGESSDKPDVTIQMNVANFLKLFNRELAPATAFMTGQIKVTGDLSKALTLEKVMKSARDAAEKAAKS